MAKARGRRPKLTAAQSEHLVEAYASSVRTVGEIGALKRAISRATVDRTLERAGARPF